jgi:ATP-dependent RNA helicase RhlE
VLTPTRELALQVSESFKAYGKFTGLRTAVLFGGVSQNPQVSELRAGPDVLVATPGRLLDLMGQKLCDLSHVATFVLDEADRMLDMGFIHDVRKVIAALPTERQTLLFSATVPNEIATLSASILRDPVRVAVTPVSSTVDAIEQSVYFVDSAKKSSLLVELLGDRSITSALVFSRTKHGANKIQKVLEKAGIPASAIHGNKSQNARQAALDGLKSGEIRILVATDIAARGIDVEQLSHVINYDLPNEPETYVHRIGRTGRAGLCGTAISFCSFDEKAYLSDIQKLIGTEIPVTPNLTYPMQVFELSAAKPGRNSGGRQPRIRTDAARAGGKRLESEMPGSGRFGGRQPDSETSGSGRFASDKTGRQPGDAQPAGRRAAKSFGERQNGQPARQPGGLLTAGSAAVRQPGASQSRKPSAMPVKKLFERAGGRQPEQFRPGQESARPDRRQVPQLAAQPERQQGAQAGSQQGAQPAPQQGRARPRRRRAKRQVSLH